VSLNFVIPWHVGVISHQQRRLQKSYNVDFIGPPCSRTQMHSAKPENCQKVGFISKHKESLDNLLLTLGTYLNGGVHRAIYDL
jgi:hypothetical protein